MLIEHLFWNEASETFSCHQQDKINT